MNFCRMFRYVLLTGLVFALLACGRGDEQAQALLEQGARAEHLGDLDLAAQHYRQIIAEYPRSAVAQQASTALLRLQGQEEEAARQRASLQDARNEAYRAIESIIKVVDGYNAMFGRRPQRASDFDNAAYFFDTDYMAKSVPNGYGVYLALLPDGPARIWVHMERADSAYALDAATNAFVKIPWGQALQTLSGHFVEERRIGGLVFLQPRAGAR